MTTPAELAYTEAEEISETQLTKLPPLPSTVKFLNFAGLEITELPPLPSSLKFLICSSTLITELPPLPSSIMMLICSNTNITELPPLPPSLSYMCCFETQITELPFLPPSLNYLNLTYTQIPTKHQQQKGEKIKEFIRRHNNRLAREKMLKRCLPLLLNAPKDCFLVDCMYSDILSYL